MSKRKSSEVLFSEINGKTRVLECDKQGLLIIKIYKEILFKSSIKDDHGIVLNMIYARVILSIDQKLSKEWYNEFILFLRNKMLIPNNKFDELISLLDDMRF